MKYKEIENLFRSKNDIYFKTLRNITFTCFNSEKQISHLSNLKRYFTNLEYSKIIDFVDYLKQNTEIKNCLDGLDLPTKFIAVYDFFIELY